MILALGEKLEKIKQEKLNKNMEISNLSNGV
jgi:hypothetical protein